MRSNGLPEAVAATANFLSGKSGDFRFQYAGNIGHVRSTLRWSLEKCLPQFSDLDLLCDLYGVIDFYP